MDNRDREKDLNSEESESSFDKGSSSSGSWDNEPSRSPSSGMEGDKGRSSGIERESDIGSDDTERISGRDMEH